MFLMPMYVRYDEFAYLRKTNQSREQAHAKHY